LILPLPAAALAIIESVPERVDRDQLFGDRAASGFTQWNLGRLALNGRLKGVGPWRPHDLRRTAATRMGDLGVQPHVVESILNHYGGFRSGASGTYTAAHMNVKCAPRWHYGLIMSVPWSTATGKRLCP
jgi:integrase